MNKSRKSRVFEYPAKLELKTALQQCFAGQRNGTGFHSVVNENEKMFSMFAERK